MNGPLLFSELLIKSKIKPDMNLVKKIDEIDFPLKHVSFIKKDINNFMFHSFNELIKKQIDLRQNVSDTFTELNTNLKLTIQLDGKNYDISIKKIKKECPPYQKLNHLVFDDRILTDDFINTINKYYVYVSLVCAIAFDEAIDFISSDKHNFELNKRIVFDEMLTFWTNGFKDDFCYLSINQDYDFSDREIEFCLIQFYFNEYKKSILDLSEFKGDEWKVLNRIIEDKENYKWYVIFGYSIWQKIKNKFKNPDESNITGLLRFKDLDYKVFNKIFDDMVNQR